MDPERHHPDQLDLESVGIKNTGRILRNPTTAVLYEEALRNHEGSLAHLGPLLVSTGKYTGRAPDDKFLVKEHESAERIWWGDINRPFDPARFLRLHQRVAAYLQGKTAYIQDCYAGTDPHYRLPIRVITEYAWQSLFARNMFVRLGENGQRASFAPEFTVISVPRFRATPEIDGTHSEAFILADFARKLILIGGTGYGGEIKKSVFTLMNYLLPQRDVFPMHCSANVGKDGTTAIFFGLSGTGKTSLSADPQRTLIGDDEHGWSDRGVFNFEGGCYAKVIRLSPQAEPEIYQCTRRFGTVIENVVMDPETRRLDLDDASITENTRAAYPIDYIPNASTTGMAPHPQHIIMLTCDAFGVLPPISRLTPEQAMYHFLSGYTAKVAGTETGIVEPQATFSTCFGAPFMVLHPTVYAELLRKRMTQHRAACWLINTGWSGGGYGVGERINIGYTRKMVNAALNGLLDDVEYETEPHLGLSVPRHCPDVPDDLLRPVNTWSDKEAYHRQAEHLKNLFRENFKIFESFVEPAVREVM